MSLIFVIFSGGLLAYSSPPPDFVDSVNMSHYDSIGWWEEQTNGILVDGHYGNQDITLKSVPSYGKE